MATGGKKKRKNTPEPDTSNAPPPPPPPSQVYITPPFPPPFVPVYPQPFYEEEGDNVVMLRRVMPPSRDTLFLQVPPPSAIAHLSQGVQSPQATSRTQSLQPPTLPSPSQATPSSRIPIPHPYVHTQGSQVPLSMGMQCWPDPGFVPTTDASEAGSDPRGHLWVTWGVYICAGKPPLADIILSHPPSLTRCDSVIGLAIPAMSGHIQYRGAASGDLYIRISQINRVFLS